VSLFNFLKTAYNSVNDEKVSSMEFREIITDKMKLLGVEEAFLSRPVNEGFSGGEKKRNEILQMAILDPRLAILDETDSGLDIDAMKIVARGVNALRGKDRAIVMVTHYQRLLDYVVPDFVHVLTDGRIATSGGKELALKLEEKGYSWLEKEPQPAAEL
jgi:Fe-S cluster assembly ATP-binding protein